MGIPSPAFNGGHSTSSGSNESPFKLIGGSFGDEENLISKIIPIALIALVALIIIKKL